MTGELNSQDEGEEQGLLASAYHVSYRLGVIGLRIPFSIGQRTVGWDVLRYITAHVWPLADPRPGLRRNREREDAMLHEKEEKRRFGRQVVFFDAVAGPVSLSSVHIWWLAL